VFNITDYYMVNVLNLNNFTDRNVYKQKAIEMYVYIIFFTTLL